MENTAAFLIYRRSAIALAICFVGIAAPSIHIGVAWQVFLFVGLFAVGAAGWISKLLPAYASLAALSAAFLLGDYVAKALLSPAELTSQISFGLGLTLAVVTLAACFRAPTDRS